MRPKLFFLFLFTAGCYLIDACKNYCGDVPSMFDFHELAISEPIDPWIPVPQATGKLVVSPDSIQYFASIYLPTVSTAVYCTSCDDPGYNGPKYAITNVDIFTLNDFDNTHPAGSLMNDVYYLYEYPTGTNDSLLTEKTNFDVLYSAFDAIWLYSKTLPNDTTLRYDLKVVVRKNNGTQAEGVVQNVKFK